MAENGRRATTRVVGPRVRRANPDDLASDGQGPQLYTLVTGMARVVTARTLRATPDGPAPDGQLWMPRRLPPHRGGQTQLPGGGLKPRTSRDPPLATTSSS